MIEKYWDKSKGQLIGLVQTGSHLYGLETPESDEDWTGIFVEPPEAVLGVDDPPKTILLKEGKLDICFMSLRHWAKLAAKGNPSAIELLFAPSVPIRPEVWNLLRLLKVVFLGTAQISQAYWGFAGAQRKLGTEKSLRHTLRLLDSAEELLRTGKLTFPCRHREMLIKKYDSTDDVKGLIGSLERAMKLGRLSSKLPESVDRVALSSQLAATYQQCWRG